MLRAHPLHIMYNRRGTTQWRLPCLALSCGSVTLPITVVGPVRTQHAASHTALPKAKTRSPRRKRERLRGS